MMTKILLLLLPLLFLDGAHLDSDAFRRPQPGKPWMAPTFVKNSTEEISKQNEYDLDRYVNQLYQAPDLEKSYAEPQAPQRPGNGLRGYRCSQPNGYFKYTDRCDEYVKCKNFIPTTHTCPIGLHFNAYLQLAEVPCDHPSRVRCNSQKPRYPFPDPIQEPSTTSTTTTTTTTTTTPLPPIPTRRPKLVPEFNCPSPHGYFKYTDQCGEYIECKNYVPLTYTCPVGLHFNPLVPWTEYPCDYPSNVECREPVTSAPTTTTTTTTTPPPPPSTTTEPAVISPRPKTPQPNYLCSQPHGYFRHSSQCDEYVECKNYVPLTYTCPVGLHFNPLVPWTEYPCDYPSNVECREPVTSAPTTTTTTTTTTTPPPPTSTTIEPVVIAPQPKTPQPNHLCPQPHGYFRHSDQCDEYVECKNYVPLTYTCPVGLHFNPRVPWTEYPCDYPSNVECREPVTSAPTTTTTTTTTTTPPSTTTEPAVIAPQPKTPQPNHLCPQPHGYFRHSNQCDEYVECKNYVPLLFTCPIGLHFNPQAQWTEYPCAHPSQVPCEETSFNRKK